MVFDEFALENDAEPEARRNRLPDSFAGLHFEQRPRPDARFGEPGFEDFARDRTTLANDGFATGDIADRDGAPLRPRMVAAHEQDDAIHPQKDADLTPPPITTEAQMLEALDIIEAAINDSV